MITHLEVGGAGEVRGVQHAAADVLVVVRRVGVAYAPVQRAVHRAQHTVRQQDAALCDTRTQ